jgi:hypothetical protein
VSLLKKPELGEAVISVHAESQYLEFSMAASVQGWRKKWFISKTGKLLPLINTALPLSIPPRK